MVGIYCHKHLHQCKMPEEYAELIEYSWQRLDYCRYGERKPACKDCPVHCYKPEMREKMQKVMRWAGPRIAFYSPCAALRHIRQSFIVSIKNVANIK